MKVVADTSVFLAVVLDETEKPWLIEMTDGYELVAPAVLPYEIGNALSGLARRRLLSGSQLSAAWDAAAAIPVELATIDMRAALVMAGRHGIYAYDAYFLQCAIDSQCPLLTLDRGMRRVAAKINIHTVEES